MSTSKISNTKRAALATVMLLGCAAVAPAFAAHLSVNVGVGLPVVGVGGYYAPPPVVYAPAPVVYGAAPVVYAPGYYGVPVGAVFVAGRPGYYYRGAYYPRGGYRYHGR